MAEGAHRQQVGGDYAQSGQRRGAAMCQVGNPDHQNQYPQQQHIQILREARGKNHSQSLDGIHKSGGATMGLNV